MIVGKDSSSLGYPGEFIQPLNADHNNVCKFPSRENSNYQVVSSILVQLISRYRDNCKYHEQSQQSYPNQYLQPLRCPSQGPHQTRPSWRPFWGCRVHLRKPTFLSSIGGKPVLAELYSVHLSSSNGNGRHSLLSYGCMLSRARENQFRRPSSSATYSEKAIAVNTSFSNMAIRQNNLRATF